MRIISLNLNGIRSATKKGLFDWLKHQRADIFCMQELRVHADQITAEMRAAGALQGYFHTAERKGYSGVGIYSRHAPDRIITGLGFADIDIEGRYLQLDFGKLSVASVYLPSGSSGEERQRIKFGFMERFLPHLEKLSKSSREHILCGDWNIAHKEIDLKNWRGNRKNSGFLPEERAWMEQLLTQRGWVDVFRRLNDKPEQYTWWSNRGRAWDKNVGWRIDYHIATPGIAAAATRESMYKERHHARDHRRTGTPAGRAGTAAHHRLQLRHSIKSPY